MSTALTYQYQPSYDEQTNAERETTSADEQARRVDGRMQRQIREPCKAKFFFLFFKADRYVTSA